MKRKVFWTNPGYRPGESLRSSKASPYLIVGGGIAGLSVAYFLLKKGVPGSNISLVEGSKVGSGSTGRSAGMLIPEPENEDNLWWDALIRRYGLSLTKKYRLAHLSALKEVSRIIRVHGIRCSAQTEDFLVLGRDSKAKKRIESDMRARRALGEHPQRLEGRYLSKELASTRFSYGNRTHKGLSVNPLAFAQGFAGALRKKGVSIYEETPLISVKGKTAYFPKGEIEFERIIYTRGTGERAKALHAFITTVAVTERLPQKILRTLALADFDMFIDEEGARSFHYGKITADKRLLLGYGDVKVNARTATAALHTPHLRNIQTFLKSAFPTTALPIEYAWSGVYSLSRALVPLVKVGKTAAVINGGGIQLTSIVAAEYIAEKLTSHKHHSFDGLWK